MTDTKFTPGPWFTGIDSATGQVGRVRASHKGGRDNVCVSEVPPAKDSAERAANAHLIAAAPDLFAALLVAELACEELCQGQDPANECWVTLASIRAALNRARGL